jgi:antitoxin component of MazEF toxin-antitoxin module
MYGDTMSICISMPETTKINKYGSSIGIALSRPVLEKVYGLVVGSEVEIDYSKPPEIIIRPIKKKMRANNDKE